ncbi:MAG TPA: hypothetical protein VGJ51_11235, partial [Candidatus Angelobacter sp.]
KPSTARLQDSSRQQSAISQKGFTATNAKSAKGKIAFATPRFLCDLRALCGKRVWLSADC